MNADDDDNTLLQMLTDIQTLQNTERNYLLSIDTLQNNPELLEKTMTKINQLSALRTSMFSAFYDVYTAQNALSPIVENQLTATKIVETEINKVKTQLKDIQDNNITLLRQVQINTYYSNMYRDHLHLLYYFIGVFAFVFILTKIHQANYISISVYLFLIIIVTAIVAYYFWVAYQTLWRRDSMNYNEFDWDFDPVAANVNDNASDTSIKSSPFNSNNTNLTVCEGSQCCIGKNMTFDQASNQCIYLNS